MRNKLLALILTSVLLVISACGRTSPSLGASPSPRAGFSAPITLVFMTAPMNSYRFWQELIRGFEADNPAIHIELRYQQIPADWPEQADVMLGSMSPDAPWQDLGDRGQLLDLKPLMDADFAFNAADLLPGALDLYRYKQSIWGVPVSVSANVLVYNLNLFQSAGLPLPTTGWTWSNVWEATRRLKNAPPHEKCYRGFPDQSEVSQAALDWLAERNGGLYRFQADKVVPRLDSPILSQAIADYLGFGESIIVDAEELPHVQTVSETLRRLAARELCFAMLPLRSWASERVHYPDLAAIPLPPGYLAAQRAVTGRLALFISAGTAHPEAAWRWLSFVSQQALGVTQWGDFAARRSVAEREQNESDTVSLLNASLAIQTTYLEARPEIDAIYLALAETLATAEVGKDIQSALTQAQRQAEAEIAAQQAQRKRIAPAPFSVKSPTRQGAISIAFQAMTAEELYRAAAVEFAQEYPDWQVNVVGQGPDTAGGCIMGYVDGSALSTAFISTSLADMTPFFEVDPRLVVENFFPQASSAMRWQSKLYLMPLSIKPLMVYHNPTIFRELGLAAPDASWTIETILQTAEAINAAQSDYLGYLPSPEASAFILAQQGVSLFTADHPPQPRFAASDVMAAVMRWQRLNPTPAATLSWADRDGRIRSGQVAMWLNLFDVRPGEAPIPNALATPIHLRPSTSLPIQLGVAGIVRTTPQPQGCWEWLTFLAQQGIRPADELPALRRLAEAEAQQSGPNQTLYQAYLRILQDDTAAPVTTLAHEGAIWWFTAALRTSADTDITSALQTAQAKAEAFLACLGPAGENDLDRAAECAQQVDPAHPLAQLRREQ